MLTVERVSSICNNKLNLFVTQDRVKRFAVMGILKKAYPQDLKSHSRASKYNYGISKESFKEFLVRKGFTHEEIARVLYNY